MIKKEKFISSILFFILIILGLFLIESKNELFENQINKHSKKIIETKSFSVEKSISESTVSASILGKYIEIMKGNMENFPKFSKIIFTSLKGISNLQLAPNAIVSKIYPLKGNEKAIGHDLFNSDNRKREAFLAKDTRQLTLAGPFPLIQGGIGMIARQPIYIEDRFWGFASTMIMIDELLATTELHKLKNHNYLYRIKRIHPDTNSFDIFAGTKVFPEGKVFTKEINLPNSKWYIEIIYIGSYISNTIIYFLYIGVFIISILLSYLFYIILNKPIEIENRKKELEKKVKEQTIEIQNNLETIKKHVIYSKTDLHGIITDVSDAFCDISGYERNELIGKPHNIVRHPDNHKSFYKGIWSLLKSNKKWSGEIKNLKKDGSFYWVNAEIDPDYNQNKEKIGYISIRQDITIQKELENQQAYIIEQDKMASLGLLIGNIAHQWRQPLNVISVSASGLKLNSELNTLDNKTLCTLTDEIIKHTQYLSNTIETFRNFILAKDEDKLISIKDTLNMIRGNLEDSKIKLKDNTSFEDKNNNFMLIGALSHVIINIINNSKDILIKKNIINPWIKLDFELKEDSYMVTIEDNGGGISSNILPHIFEPYFTTKHQSQGTGLSLYLSYKIVKEELKGDFFIENTNNGAKSFLKIPLKK